MILVGKLSKLFVTLPFPINFIEVEIEKQVSL
jgi:hypothetical protein